MNRSDIQKGQPIVALIADVDGTLVTKEKVLTPRAIASVKSLHERGVVFCITSGRPPRGLDERPFRTEKALLVRVQDRDEGDFRKIEPFAEEVDPDKDVELSPPQTGEDLNALNRFDITVQVFSFDSSFL